MAGRDLHAAFIEFADTFVDDYDVVDFLHRLAERCVELVDAAEAGIMLADSHGTLQYVASSTSSSCNTTKARASTRIAWERPCSAVPPMT